MKGILEILNAYNGGKLLLALYLVCLIYLWRYEKSRNQRLLLVWLPLFFLLLFLLPPVCRIYSRIDSARTYYRLLWILPMTLTIAYSGVRIFAANLRAGLAVMCALIVLSGQYIYSNENILKAEKNR